MTQRQLFLNHIGQTSEAPLCLNITKANGSLMWDEKGKEYIDLIAGISVCNIGHCHPEVVKAIKQQAEQHLHIMVYGELIENPQVAYAKLLTEHLPASLNSVFFTSSGSEATEGAMKLAKRFTGRSEMVSFNNSYHGSTQGSLSLMGSDYWQQAFRPLLPGISRGTFNDEKSLALITSETACVVAETVQAEAGVLVPERSWMKKLRERCNETGALLVLDEIQCGFGRTGTLWCFEQYDIIPDILLLGKALGGGMPLGAFIADKKVMDALSFNPVLGHITTFGGHPVSCAAGLAAMRVLLNENLIANIEKKSRLFLSLLKHPAISKVTATGLLIAVHFKDFEMNKKIIDQLIKEGVFTDWFLFAPQALRIAPPLNISDDLIEGACKKIVQVIEQYS